MERLKQSVIEYFENCLDKHGDSAQGVDYNGKESQYQRFEILASVAPLEATSVLDVACGLGHFYDFLVEKKSRPSAYKGIDISPAMIKNATARHPELEFGVEDILELEDPPAPLYDYVVCCGLFHLRADNSDKNWNQFSKAMIKQMFKYARRGLAFNMMTDQVDFKVERLYYANPTEFFDFCRYNLNRRVCLRQDYPLYEFTIYVYR